MSGLKATRTEAAREISGATGGNKKKRARARANAKREPDESCERAGNDELAKLASELEYMPPPSVVSEETECEPMRRHESAQDAANAVDNMQIYHYVAATAATNSDDDFVHLRISSKRLKD